MHSCASQLADLSAALAVGAFDIREGVGAGKGFLPGLTRGEDLADLITGSSGFGGSSSHE